MSVTITGNAPLREQQAYVDYLENKYNRKLKTLDINIDEEFADLTVMHSRNSHHQDAHDSEFRRCGGAMVRMVCAWK